MREEEEPILGVRVVGRSTKGARSGHQEDTQVGRRKSREQDNVIRRIQRVRTGGGGDGGIQNRKLLQSIGGQAKWCAHLQQLYDPQDQGSRTSSILDGKKASLKVTCRSPQEPNDMVWELNERTDLKSCPGALAGLSIEFLVESNINSTWVAHFRGCDTVFNKDTSEPDLQVVSIYVPGEEACCAG